MKNLKIFTDDVEQVALDQIDELLSQDAFKDAKVRIMPDVHAGKGCVIGFTGDLGDKVIPNIVGVDIGCGMLCVELGKVDIDLKELDDVIRTKIPSGMNVHDKPIRSFALNSLFCYDELKDKDWIQNSIGTLGGGNHFIEVDKDDEDNKYLVIHTGSRNLGKQVADIYQKMAIKNCSYDEEMRVAKRNVIDKLKSEGREREIQEQLDIITAQYRGRTKLPKDLCYLDGKLREDYLHDMKICQRFASVNRFNIAMIILESIFPNSNYVEPGTEEYGVYYSSDRYSKIEPVDISMFSSVHNYISFDDNIIRKGAISAKKGERVLIPMNMRDGCIIGIGKGNDDWNQSAPHGAGRIMSRSKARETIDIKDFKDSMKDIYTTSVNEQTIDESPFAYKPMDEIIKNIGDTVEIEKIIKPIYNFKASE